MRLKELSRDTHKRKANPQIPHSYHWASFLVSLCSICQGMTSAENILSQLVKLPIWWLALFWEHLVYHHIWGSNWSFFHHWGQLFPRNWPSNWARRSWIKFFFFHLEATRYIFKVFGHFRSAWGREGKGYALWSS